MTDSATRSDLTAALALLIRWRDASLSMEPPDFIRLVDDTQALIDAAPAAEPVPLTLDAERLARAMSRLAEVGPPAHLDIRDAEEHWPSYLVEAQDLAAEYAALARPEPSAQEDRPARDLESPAP